MSTDIPDLPSRSWSCFWFFIKKYPFSFAVCFIAPMSMVLESNLIPYALKLIVDGIGAHKGDRSAIFKEISTGLYLGGFSWLGFVIILRLQNWWMGYFVPKLQADIRMRSFAYLSSHSYSYFSNRLAGNLANKVADLPRAFENIRNILSWNGVSTISSVLVALVLMATINRLFSFILFIWMVVQLTISIYFAKRITAYSKENAEDKSVLSGKIVDSLSNIAVVKLFSRKKEEVDYILKSQNKEKTSNNRLIIYLNVFRFFLDIPVTIMLAVMVYFLIAYWQHAYISTGDLVFVFYASFSVIWTLDIGAPA